MEDKDLGRIVVTRGINDKMNEDKSFANFVNRSLERYLHYDWGELDEVDKRMNDNALKNGERLFASYKYKNGKIWIITEWDRSATTILFPDEY